MTDWRKSSYSSTADNCVEVGRGVGVRDSKAPATHLPVSAESWTAFLTDVKGDSAR
ncbi:DUF397 domain-containing protein [Lentzea albidocapillata]|uniref:DUF397 domain-containing protein n=2 Tax=Lentzea albidocapillata TaxID=40571 RepID=A0A1W2FMN8_9PSEU|nr:DUF397 domain-containing protein [Lentzea albidocapillata]SDM80719.1 protein of unknown function [Lentzea albidocapillata subsp. violacea]SMD23201.1 protein of unknown function [Lentzea albidocapillata]